jgi:two-component system phosphate regulon sensor histidine kinase PhoR
LAILVQDNGIGMSEEVQKNVFEKFYRGEKGDVHTVKGFGLGLSYVKSIVKAHQGTLSLTSHLGEGSIFTINLPQLGTK